MTKCFSSHSISLLLILSGVFFTGAASNNWVKDAHTEVELIAEAQSVQPGTRFLAAVRFKMDPEWHVYWKNPGDSGTAPEIRWELPEGVTAGEIQWPIPEKIEMTPLANYGYEGEVLLLVPISVSESVPAGRDLVLKAQVDFLACKIECIPGTAAVKLVLPVKNQTPRPNQKWKDAFSLARGNIPRALPTGWNIKALIEGDLLKLNIVPPPETPSPISNLYFFPENGELIQHTARQEMLKSDLGFELGIPLSVNRPKSLDRLIGVLAFSGGAFEINVPLAEFVPLRVEAFPEDVMGTAGIGLLTALLFAFLGGIILNLMPCVLPVLSLKVLGFMKEASEKPRSLVKHGLVFTAGVLVSFWLLAGLLIALKIAGSEIGWGFQLQSPSFLTALIFLFFLFALNLFDVFEIGTSLAGAGQSLVRTSGYVGSFSSGVLATVVATPCTAPFMGSALGYALAQPIWISFAVFTSLGLGMALPFLVLCANPVLIRFLPKPGLWMITMKQILGFLLLATVLWLLWVFSLQTAKQSVLILASGLLISGVGVWVLGKWTGPAAGFLKRVTARGIAFILIIAGILFSLSGIEPETHESAFENGEISWEMYSDKRLTELRNEGRPVFIDFTAAWCLTCQVNKRLTLHSSKVVEAFSDKNVAALSADWTNRDETVTRALARYGRNSIPLYVYYPAGAQEPVILPELLTPSIVTEVLEKSE